MLNYQINSNVLFSLKDNTINTNVKNYLILFIMDGYDDAK